MGAQFLPFAHGMTTTIITCAAGPVPWTVFITPMIGPYRSPAMVSVAARLTRAGVVEATYSGAGHI